MAPVFEPDIQENSTTCLSLYACLESHAFISGSEVNVTEAYILMIFLSRG